MNELASELLANSVVTKASEIDICQCRTAPLRHRLHSDILEAARVGGGPTDG